MMPFIKLAAASPVLTLGDPARNAAQAIELCREAAEQGVSLLLFPELSLTGITCGDYFLRGDLLGQARDALFSLLKSSRDFPSLTFSAGLPREEQGMLFMLHVLIKDGAVLLANPRQHLEPDPRLPEAPDLRKIFRSGSDIIGLECPELGVAYRSDAVLVQTPSAPLRLRLLAGQDLWNAACETGLILHPFARPVIATGEDDYGLALRQQVLHTGAEILAAGSGKGESGGDFYYRGALYHYSETHALQRYETLAKAEKSELLITGLIPEERTGRARREPRGRTPAVNRPAWELPGAPDLGDRVLSPHPLFPYRNTAEYLERLVEFIQAGLHRRLRSLRGQKAVIGYSGGLDSTLALLILYDYYLKTERKLEDLLAYTLPGPGSGEEGYRLALDLMTALGLEPRSIDITAAVEKHLKDIGQPDGLMDVTFENAQARERTQILMDLANRLNGIVIGTGDLSEKALGWSTYNGDQMSMYEINSGVPKTLIPHLLRHFLPRLPTEARPLIEAVIQRPISPELVPPSGAEGLQSTERTLGPYALHDFFIYYADICGASTQLLLETATLAFDGRNLERFMRLSGEAPQGGAAETLQAYPRATIAATLKIFQRRFARNQFKRSASAEGIKTGPVSYAPRQGLQVPSDYFGRFLLED